MTLKNIERRSYQSEAKWIGGLSNTFQFTPVKGDALIGEVDALKFLFTLLERIGAKTTYTVAEIAEKAYKNAIGSGDYFIIATRQMFS